MSNPFSSEIPDRSVAASTNPYAPTEFRGALPVGDSSAVETRNRYLSHEASIQGIGSLYLLGAVFLLLFGIVALISILAATSQGNSSEVGLSLIIGAVYLIWGSFQFWVGRGLRTLRPKVRVPAIVLSAIGLIGFPIGTIISGYFLYLLTSKKGVFVFSDEYAQVRAATPEIKYRTSVWVWLALLAIILLIVGLIVVGTSTR